MTVARGPGRGSPVLRCRRFCRLCLQNLLWLDKIGEDSTSSLTFFLAAFLGMRPAKPVQPPSATVSHCHPHAVDKAKAKQADLVGNAGRCPGSPTLFEPQLVSVGSNQARS